MARRGAPSVAAAASLPGEDGSPALAAARMTCPGDGCSAMTGVQHHHLGLADTGRNGTATSAAAAVELARTAGASWRPSYLPVRRDAVRSQGCTCTAASAAGSSLLVPNPLCCNGVGDTDTVPRRGGRSSGDADTERAVAPRTPPKSACSEYHCWPQFVADQQLCL